MSRAEAQGWTQDAPTASAAASPQTTQLRGLGPNDAPLRWTIAQTWDGQSVAADEHVLCTLRNDGLALHWTIDAPWFGDAPPVDADGQPLPPGSTARLWEHEVVELMLLGDDDRYLELEVGPYGHYLALSLHGVRNVVAQGMALAISPRPALAGSRWRASVAVPLALLPPGPLRLNAFAIAGTGPQRRYLALQPAFGERPDFHVLHAFVALRTLLLVQQLRDALGDDAVATDADTRAAWGRDRTQLRPPAPCAVVWPRDTAGVQAVVRSCAALGVAIVPSGGRTGLAGGAIAADGELVLSLARMDAIAEVDVVGRTLVVQAGATNLAVQQACAPHGLQWPIDLASKGSATIGGNIATNAGGVRVIRYGHTRSWVLGLEVVTAAGDLIRVGGALEKDNTGLDLRQLFIGSEGTLGVVTAATLKLAPLPGPTEVALVAVETLPVALTLLAAARALPATIGAFEVLSDVCLAAVMAHRGVAAPFSASSAGAAAPWLVLIEVEPKGPLDMPGWLAACLGLPGVRDAIWAVDARQRRALWAYREDISESLAPRRPHKNDVAVPVAALPAFVDALLRLVQRRQGWQIALFGHVGYGNLHVNALCPPDGTPLDRAALAAADDEFFALVVRYGGSISAEHGIGLLKVGHLHQQRGAAERALMAAVKAALDPAGMLNPGNVLPSAAAAADAAHATAAAAATTAEATE